MASEGLHEEASTLGPDTIERHRAIVSLGEELEAIDWYDQRIAATSDDGLRSILVHNRDEEKEHAAMVLAWLAARDPVLAAELADKLGPRREGETVPRAPGDGSLGIGSLRGRSS